MKRPKAAAVHKVGAFSLLAWALAGALSASFEGEHFCLEPIALPSELAVQAQGFLRIESCSANFSKPRFRIFKKKGGAFVRFRSMLRVFKDFSPLSAFGHACSAESSRVIKLPYFAREGDYLQVGMGHQGLDRVWLDTRDLKGCSKGMRRRIIDFKHLCPDFGMALLFAFYTPEQWQGFKENPKTWPGEPLLELREKPDASSKVIKLRAGSLRLLDQQGAWVNVAEIPELIEGSPRMGWMTLRDEKGRLRFWPEDLGDDNIEFETSFNCQLEVR